MQQYSSHGGDSTRVKIYDMGLEELRRVSVEDASRKKIETDFTEARGRETARLHVTLKALDEMETQTLDSIERLASELDERSNQLKHLVENFEASSGKHLDDVHGRLTERVGELQRAVGQQVDEVRNVLSEAQRQNFDALTRQVGDFRGALTNEVQGSTRSLAEQSRQQFDSLSALGRESTEAVSRDVADARDELVKLVDSRMNQADASFAALRGDIEVLKYLVMDIIKSRVGRTDPNQRPI